MKIGDFEKVDRHPYEMLAGLGLEFTMECEQNLAYILRQCQKAGNLDAVVELEEPEYLLDAKLVIEAGDWGKVRLTEKAKGLLYSEYHKKK